MLAALEYAGARGVTFAMHEAARPAWRCPSEPLPRRENRDEPVPFSDRQVYDGDARVSGKLSPL